MSISLVLLTRIFIDYMDLVHSEIYDPRILNETSPFGYILLNHGSINIFFYRKTSGPLVHPQEQQMSRSSHQSDRMLRGSTTI